MLSGTTSGYGSSAPAEPEAAEPAEAPEAPEAAEAEAARKTLAAAELADDAFLQAFQENCWEEKEDLVASRI